MLEQHPNSVEMLTLIPKETVQQLRVPLNLEHSLFGVLLYAEILAHLCNPCPHPLHPNQLLLTESVQDFINREQEAHQERVETGEYMAPGEIQTSHHDVNRQQH